MHVVASMLADSAQVQNGKLYVLGGGFDTIRTRSVPAIHKLITVVLVLEVASDERHTDLDIRVTLMDEDMNPVGAEASGMLRGGGPCFAPARPDGVRPARHAVLRPYVSPTPRDTSSSSPRPTTNWPAFPSGSSRPPSAEMGRSAQCRCGGSALR